MRVIAIDSSATVVQLLRKRGIVRGEYGRRFSALVGDPLTMKLPPYLASLVVSERAVLPDGAAQLKRQLERILRPYEGVACLRKPAVQLAGFDETQFRVEPHDKLLVVRRFTHTCYL